MTGFKPLKCSAGRLQCSAGRSTTRPCTAMAPGIPAAAAMASYRRSRLPFDRLQTPKMLRRPFAMLRQPVHHKATAMAPGIPAAAAMASYRRSRLPFDRLQTPKMLRRPFAMLRRPVAPSPVAVSPCCSSVAPAGKSHHKATAMAQGIPAAAAMAIGVRGCRLTGFKPLKCFAGRLQCSAGRLCQAL